MSQSSPMGRRQLGRLEADLSERDVAVFQSVASLRYLTARQIEAWHFADHASPISAARTCRRVLERLTKQRVLTRLDRRVGGIRAGSASFCYRLGPVGERLVRNDGVRRRGREPSATFLDHTLAVAQTVVDLEVDQRQRAWEVIAIEAEPNCWRAVRAGLGSQETLKPDLFVILGVDDYEHRYFVEVDRGTEHLPTVLRKCLLYDTYYRTGSEQEAHGVFPKVLWIVPTPKRAEEVVVAVGRERGLEQNLFVVATADDSVTAMTEDAS